MYICIDTYGHTHTHTERVLRENIMVSPGEVALLGRDTKLRQIIRRLIVNRLVLPGYFNPIKHPKNKTEVGNVGGWV